MKTAKYLYFSQSCVLLRKQSCLNPNPVQAKASATAVWCAILILCVYSFQVRFPPQGRNCSLQNRYVAILVFRSFRWFLSEYSQCSNSHSVSLTPMQTQLCSLQPQIFEAIYMEKNILDFSEWGYVWMVSMTDTARVVTKIVGRMVRNYPADVVLQR